jgi:hypothetical protein
MSDKWLHVQHDEVRARTRRQREENARIVEARAQAAKAKR